MYALDVLDMQTYETFKANLKAGEYQAVAGARRALGRIKISEEERALGQKLINKHFNVEAAPEKEESSKKSPKAPKVKAEKKAAVALEGKKAPKGKRGMGKRASKVAHLEVGIGEAYRGTPYAILEMANKAIGSSGQILDQAKALSVDLGADPKLVSQISTKVCRILDDASSLIQDALVPLISDLGKGMNETPARTKSNGIAAHAEHAEALADLLLGGPQDPPDVAARGITVDDRGVEEHQVSSALRRHRPRTGSVDGLQRKMNPVCSLLHNEQRERLGAYDELAEDAPVDGGRQVHDHLLVDREALVVLDKLGHPRHCEVVDVLAARPTHTHLVCGCLSLHQKFRPNNFFRSVHPPENA